MNDHPARQWHEQLVNYLQDNKHLQDYHNEFDESDVYPETRFTPIGENQLDLVTTLGLNAPINIEVIYVASPYVSEDHRLSVVLIQANGPNFKPENCWLNAQTFVWGTDNPNWPQDVYNSILEIMTTC